MLRTAHVLSSIQKTKTNWRRSIVYFENVRNRNKSLDAGFS